MTCARARAGQPPQEGPEGGGKSAEEATDDAIRCTVDDEKCLEDAEKDGKDVVIVDEGDKPVENPQERPDDETTEYEAPGEDVRRNYDFVPGTTNPSTNVMFTTRGILFAFNSDALLPESTPILEEIFSTLERYLVLAIVIEGHTDSVGEDAYNLELSERRAASVVAYLVKRGIDAGRLQRVGKGESDPVADNTAEAGRQQNRRVVIRLQE